MESRIETLDRKMNFVSMHLAKQTLAGALIGFSVGLAFGRARTGLIFGAGVGSGVGL
jgi:tetrahydromethanopterin S-methyltransferase subunit G